MDHYLLDVDHIGQTKVKYLCHTLCDYLFLKILFLQALKWMKCKDLKVYPKNRKLRLIDQVGIRAILLLETNGACLDRMSSLFVKLSVICLLQSD